MTNKQLIVFDLDGTLAESKTMMDSEMGLLLTKVLKIKQVAVVSGASYSQFENQFLKSLQNHSANFKNLFLFPTCSTSFYRYNGGWQCVYNEALNRLEREKIMKAFGNAFRDIGYAHPDKLYGKVIEDRETQITFSALGQQAPLELKQKWDCDGAKRRELKKALEKHLPEFEVHIGGTTSVDVTRKGIDKAYAIQQIEKHLSVEKKDMLFIGDALFEGGNDYPVKQAGVECISVFGPEDTKRVLRNMVL